MIKIIFADFIRIFQPPTAEEMVREELELAKRELLKAHSAEEYARAMAQYHQERITRLIKINQQEATCPSNASNSGTNEHGPIPLKKTSASSSDATWKSSWK